MNTIFNKVTEQNLNCSQTLHSINLFRLVINYPKSVEIKLLDCYSGSIRQQMFLDLSQIKFLRMKTHSFDQIEII